MNELKKYLSENKINEDNASFRKLLLHLEQHDKISADKPDFRTAFIDVDDAFDRLNVYRTYQTAIPSDETVKAVNKQIESATNDLLTQIETLENELIKLTQRECEEAVPLELQVMMAREMCSIQQDRLKLERLVRGRLLNPERMLSIIHGLKNTYTIPPSQESTTLPSNS